MAQLLLFSDPRPLVEQLGPEFFRRAPERPGVYLMRDAAETVLYVGKAKNLRRRLASYRVANPDRMRRRHLRLLRAVARIELQCCPDEAAALAREAELLRTLRPRFNRAGTWPATPRFLAWRTTEAGLALSVVEKPAPEWRHFGPLGAGVISLHALLARLIWWAIHPERGVAGLPGGWFGGSHQRDCSIPRSRSGHRDLDRAAELLPSLFSGQLVEFTEWILTRTGSWTHAFDLAARQADLEALTELAGHSFGANVRERQDTIAGRN